MKPKVAGAYRVRGDIKKEIRDFNGALRDLNYGIKLNKSNPGLYLSRAMLYDRMEKRSKAIKDLKKADELGISNNDDSFKSEFHLLIGMMSSTINKHKAAIESFSIAIECDPKDSQLYKERADTLEYLGYEEEAIQDRNRAEELSAS